MDNLSKYKFYPCEVRRSTVKIISVTCIKCGKWIHSGCAGEKMVTKFSRNFACRKCE